MKKVVILSIFSAILFIFGTGNLSAQVVVKVIPPKPKVILPVPAKPNPGHVWIAGHWKWDKKAGKYVWIKGHWEKPPRPGAKWVPGHWVDTPNGHKWVPGHWKAPKALPPKHPIQKPRK